MPRPGYCVIALGDTPMQAASDSRCEGEGRWYDQWTAADDTDNDSDDNGSMLNSGSTGDGDEYYSTAN